MRNVVLSLSLTNICKMNVTLLLHLLEKAHTTGLCIFTKIEFHAICVACHSPMLVNFAAKMFMLLRSCTLLLLLFHWHLQPTCGFLASSVLRFRDHTQGCTTFGRTPLDERSVHCRDLYLTNTQQTNIHALVGIRTRNPSRRAVADPHLRPLGHWNWQVLYIISENYPIFEFHNKFIQNVYEAC
jgi:hypothetical protein